MLKTVQIMKSPKLPIRNAGRVAIRGAAAIALAIGMLAIPTAGQAISPDEVENAPPYSSWFRYKKRVAENWEINGFEDNPYKVRIRLRGDDAIGGVETEPRWRVFVLYSKRSSAYDVAISKILEMFAERGVQAEITVMNFRRDNISGNEALKLANEEKMNLIFTMGSQSTAWLWKHYRGGEIPVVSVTSKDPVILGQTEDYDNGSGTNFAFTSLNMPVEAQMAYVHELKPNLKNLAILVDSNNVSAMRTQARPMAAMARSKGIRVLRLEVKKSENAAEELASMVKNAVSSMRKNDINLDHSLFWVTGSTSVFREIETINAHSDRVPVLSVVPEVVKEGDASAALSIGISFESNAHLAALYGIKVLKGEIGVGNLEVGVVTPPDIAINFRKVREIGLRIPFSFVEGASFIYDYDGKPVRSRGTTLTN